MAAIDSEIKEILRNIYLEIICRDGSLIFRSLKYFIHFTEFEKLLMNVLLKHYGSKYTLVNRPDFIEIVLDYVYDPWRMLNNSNIYNRIYIELDYRKEDVNLFLDYLQEDEMSFEYSRKNLQILSKIFIKLDTDYNHPSHVDLIRPEIMDILYDLIIPIPLIMIINSYIFKQEF